MTRTLSMGLFLQGLMMLLDLRYEIPENILLLRIVLYLIVEEGLEVQQG